MIMALLHFEQTSNLKYELKHNTSAVSVMVVFCISSDRGGNVASQECFGLPGLSWRIHFFSVRYDEINYAVFVFCVIQPCAFMINKSMDFSIVTP